MNEYTAVTFAPVQGFIEKSRKLRDLYGASLILSYLSQQLVFYVNNNGLTVISPGIPKLQKGMPNRILIKGEISKKDAETVILSAWKDILKVCREWIEKKLPEYQYHWEREWTLWGGHTWEVFHGTGCCIEAAMNDLETNKLSRDWSAVNWIGESSSLTGTDGIAFPGLGGEKRNPKNMNYGDENKEIEKFYARLAAVTQEESETPEGKFIADNEKLSIPELVKRLVTRHEIATELGIEELDKSFKEIQRKPQPAQPENNQESIPGQWTGWFMGDGDKVGDHLKELAQKENGDGEIKNFSDAMRNWGKQFDDRFNLRKKLGRIVYAGGDDFLGIIYSKNLAEPIPAFEAYQWLLTLNETWKEHKQPINVSVGFVWVGGSVPQRDVLQHCREAEKVAKSLGRDRVTIRVVFNSGQYVQWTCPWCYLDILMKYRDRDGKTFYEWECNGRDEKYFPNWSHVYNDLATLKARHAFGLSPNKHYTDVNKFNTVLVNLSSLIEFIEMYFPSYKDELTKKEKYIVCGNKDPQKVDRKKESAPLMINWIENLINIGWYLCSNQNNQV
ncbi:MULTISPECIES: type III-B CRISPR-associated protein Cas10/Cmr2 [Nostocales]|uniref:CRISPR-associated protein Cmr2 n=1 Tax=Dolichospermum flos-aquae UHCC 0037 TaxID=2590026 RepID=A0ACC7SBG3_DOLFA|nr:MULTISPECIES: type III-B CRISPR-associated protein Cas10/Cmr2 [Nostocales]MBO1065197.1 CRISPR-associated protein Cmr2 [Anabaena sp. 54]MTJ44822.1 CRISPR-associated protein Cmr2 [Dolichospermum flos-aquae UHCC 0037]